MRLTLYPNGRVWVTSSLDLYQPSLLTPLGENKNASILQLNLPATVEPESLILVDAEKGKIVPIKYQNLSTGRDHLILRLWISRSVKISLQHMCLMFLEKLPLSWHVSYRGVLSPEGDSLAFGATLHLQNSGNKDIGPAEIDIIVKDMPEPQPPTVTMSSMDFSRAARMPSPSSMSKGMHFEMSAGEEEEEREEGEEGAGFGGFASSVSFEGGSKLALPETIELLRGTVTGIPLLKTCQVPLRKNYYWPLQSHSASEQVGPARLDYRFSAIDRSQDAAKILPGGLMQLLSHEFEPIGSFYIPKVMPVQNGNVNANVNINGSKDSPSDIVIRNQTDDRVRVSSIVNEKTVPIPGSFPHRLEQDLFATVYEGEATVVNRNVLPIEIQLRLPISQAFVRKVQVSQGGDAKWNSYKRRIEIALTVFPNSQKRIRFLVVTDNWDLGLEEEEQQGLKVY